MIQCDIATTAGTPCPFPPLWLYDLDDLGRVLVCDRHEHTFGFPEGKRVRIEMNGRTT